MDEENDGRKSIAAEKKFAEIEDLCAELRASVNEIYAAVKELKARQERLTAESKAREERVNQLDAHLQGMSNTMGLIAEDVFRRDFMRIMKRAGVRLDMVETRVRRKNHERECDIIGVNDDTVVLCEVKARLRIQTVRNMNKRIATFRKDFPDYARPKLYVAVAGLSVDSSAADLARNMGFFILVERGSSLSPLSPRPFTPRAY